MSGVCLAVAGGSAAAVPHDHNELVVVKAPFVLEAQRQPAVTAAAAGCAAAAEEALLELARRRCPATARRPGCRQAALRHPRRRRSAPRPPCLRRFSRREFTPTLPSESHARNAGPWFNLCPQRVSGAVVVRYLGANTAGLQNFVALDVS